MKVVPIEIIKGLSGKICQHSDTSVAYNSVSGKMHTCKICNPRTEPATEKQLAQQEKFKTQATAVTAWLNQNKPSTTNPQGTPAYRTAQALRRTLMLSNVRQVLFKYLDKSTNQITLPSGTAAGGGSTETPDSGSTGGGDNLEEL